MNKGTITKKDHQQKTALPKTTHLLCIGINKYGNGIATLNNAVRDARAFEKILSDRYGVLNSTSLYDEAATLEGIFNAFDELKKTITKEDNLIIYFSGHGELVDDQGYWIPIDATLNKRHTYLANYEIKNLLKVLKAHHVLVIVDACFSGALLQRDRQLAVTRYYTIPSRWVMTSGQVEVVPDGLAGYHSPFAKSLLTQLELNPKPYLSVRELWLDMREGVIANSKQTPLCEPVRDANHQGGEYYFIDKNATELPPIPESTKETVGSLKTIETIEKPLEKAAILKLSFTQLKEKLQKLFLAGKTKEALEILVIALKSDTSSSTTAYLNLSNYNTLQEDIVNGIAMNAPQQKAQIKYALNYIIKNLEAEDLINS